MHAGGFVLGSNSSSQNNEASTGVVTRASAANEGCDNSERSFVPRKGHDRLCCVHPCWVHWLRRGYAPARLTPLASLPASGLRPAWILEPVGMPSILGS